MPRASTKTGGGPQKRSGTAGTARAQSASGGKRGARWEREGRPRRKAAKRVGTGRGVSRQQTGGRGGAKARAKAGAKAGASKARTRRGGSADGRSVERLVRSCVPQTSRPEQSGDLAVVVAAVEADGKGWRTQVGQASLRAGSGGRGVMARTRAAKRLTTPAKRKRLAQVVSAVASPHRLTIMAKLLEGPATYQALIKASGLKVGPLYHHINQLRLASLVGPKERDLYRLTRAGQNVLLTMLAMLPLTSDTRVVQE